MGSPTVSSAKIAAALLRNRRSQETPSQSEECVRKKQQGAQLAKRRAGAPPLRPTFRTVAPLRDNRRTVWPEMHARIAS